MRKILLVLVVFFAVGCAGEYGKVYWNENAGKAGEGRCQQVDPPYKFVPNEACGK